MIKLVHPSNILSKQLSALLGKPGYRLLIEGSVGATVKLVHPLNILAQHPPSNLVARISGAEVRLEHPSNILR